MSYKVTPTAIPDLLILEPQVFGDSRGFFFESFNAKNFAQATGLNVNFVQDNHSRSSKGVLRGLHYQVQQTQGKLVHVTQGAVFDVAVDIRKSSPTFGKWASFTLDAKTHQQIYIPEGFAHGFCTLEDQTIMNYKVSAYFSKNHDSGIFWNDPALAIDWPLKKEEAILSDKDKSLPLLQEYLGSL